MFRAEMHFRIGFRLSCWVSSGPPNLNALVKLISEKSSLEKIYREHDIRKELRGFLKVLSLALIKNVEQLVHVYLSGLNSLYK